MYERLTCDEHFELFARAYGMSPAEEHEGRRSLYAALGFERYAGARADQMDLAVAVGAHGLRAFGGALRRAAGRKGGATGAKEARLDRACRRSIRSKGSCLHDVGSSTVS